MAVCEGNSQGTQPKDRAPRRSPRYGTWHKASRNRGALSYFAPVWRPLAAGFIGGLLAMYGLCRAHPLVPVDSGRRLLEVVIECRHLVQWCCLSGTSHIRRIGQIRLSPNRAAGLPIVTGGHAFIQNVRRDHYVGVNPECDTFRDRAVRHCRAGSHGPSPRTGFLPVPPLARGKTYR